MPTPTHTAYYLDLDGKSARWLDLGTASGDLQGRFDIQLDRLPIDMDAFTGHIVLAPVGTTPPLPEPEEIRRLARPAPPSETAQ